MLRVLTRPPGTDSRSLLRFLSAAILVSAQVVILGAAEKPSDVATRLVDRVNANPASLESVLGEYNRIEASRELDVLGKHEIHQAILKALRQLKDPNLADVARDALKSSSRPSFPSQVLLLKALLAADFPAPRPERLEWLSGATRNKNRRLGVWGVRLLGDSRWPEAVDTLIEILRTEEGANPQGFLSTIVAAELYRLLGSAGQGTSAEIQKSWTSMKKKLPAEPDYSARSQGERTVVFFGDRISPFSAFVIDTSSSMKEETTLRQGGPKRPKVEIVKQELLQALGGLQSTSKFNILAYNSSFFPWKAGKGGIGLHSAGEEAIRSAKSFTERLPVAQGTNIHDSLAAALDIPDVETVYLLSDGVPSKGGGPAEIEKRAAALNYLKGIRIVTYGFTGETKGSFDEEFMKRLARDNWGWYRRLN